MEDSELKDLLSSYNHQLEEAKVLNLQSWVLNYKCYESIQSQKAKSKLKSLITFKMVAMILGIVWISFLGYLLYHSLEMSKIFFVISAGAIILFTAIAIIVYVYHIVLIRKINNSEHVIKTQETIARLQLSTINIVRILFLQTPFYSTFFWSLQWIKNDPLSFWLIAFPITLFLILISIWLYRNISYKNVNKKWFKMLFNSPEWTSLTKASAFLNEIENFKKDS
jgi:hypothetical protein